MDKGLSYTYAVSAFPRVKYLQDRLLRLAPRWQRIIDGENLPDCVFQGRLKQKNILSMVDDWTNKVTVNLFVESSVSDLSHPVLHVQENLSVEAEMTELSWSQFVRNQHKKCGPEVTVVIVPSLDSKIVRNLESLMSGISKAHYDTMIIYTKETKMNYPYNDLIKVNFKLDDRVMTGDKEIERCRTLSKQIQYILEEKVVKVLELISDFNTELLPRKQEEDTEILQDAVRTKLVRSLKDKYVVLDLSPESRIDEAEKTPTDRDLSRLAAVVGESWELLAPPLSITDTKLRDIKQLNQSVESMILNMFYLWRKKDQKASLAYLLQLLENYSSSIAVDMATVKAMKEEIGATFRLSEKDKIFHRKLAEFITKKTKCEMCDLLSKKYCLSANLVNEFLNDGFYGYEKKVQEMMKKMSLPSWPRDKPDDAVEACRKFAHTCSNALSGIIQETESYIKAKREYLTVVKKLQFQLEGLLQLTEVAIETHIPDIPKLSRELQHALLSIPEVYGCGIMWGDLTLHLTETLSASSRADIKEILSTHKYTYGYSIQIIQPPRSEAGGNSIEQGSSLRAKKLNNASEDSYSYGSIGCIVKIKSVNDGRDTSKLHCITCAHCVRDCHNVIEVHTGLDYDRFGETKYVEYNSDAIDVATIEVDSRKVRHCCGGLREATTIETPRKLRWSFYDGAIVRRTVFKFGSSTGLTSGICMCDDYRTKGILKNINSNENRNFDTDVNILIEMEPGAVVIGAGRGGQVFSAAGDSGSVVYDEDMNENDLVIALLYGSISDTEGTFLYSYASHIMRLKELLENKYNISIESAYSSQDNAGL